MLLLTLTRLFKLWYAATLDENDVLQMMIRMMQHCIICCPYFLQMLSTVVHMINFKEDKWIDQNAHRLRENLPNDCKK